MLFYCIISPDKSLGYTGFMSVVPPPYVLTRKDFDQFHLKVSHTCIVVRRGTLF